MSCTGEFHGLLHGLIHSQLRAQQGQPTDGLYFINLPSDMIQRELLDNTQMYSNYKSCKRKTLKKKHLRFRIPIDRHSKNSGQSSFHLLLPLQYHTTQHYVVHVGVGGQTVHSAAERASTKRNDHSVQARLGTCRDCALCRCHLTREEQHRTNIHSIFTLEILLGQQQYRQLSQSVADINKSLPRDRVHR